MQNSAERNEEEKIKENNNTDKIKGFAIFLSEFTFMIIPIIIMLIGIIFPSDHETTTYTSKEGPSWNSSSDPLIFTHLSDIHVKSLEDIDQFRDQFRVAKQLRANFHLLTGDYADDSEFETEDEKTTYMHYRNMPLPEIEGLDVELEEIHF